MLIRKALLVLAVVIAIHGMAFAGAAAFVAWHGWTGVAELVQAVFFWGLVVPALILTVPVDPVLWWLHLMNTPGWFAWPRPLGFALVYAIWVLALLAAAYLAGALAGRSRARPAPPTTTSP